MTNETATPTPRRNYWLTSDIKMYRASSGYYDAVHKHQGSLIDSEYYSTRTECRRDAVVILREMQHKEALDDYEMDNGYRFDD